MLESSCATVRGSAVVQEQNGVREFPVTPRFVKVDTRETSDDSSGSAYRTLLAKAIGMLWRFFQATGSIAGILRDKRFGGWTSGPEMPNTRVKKSVRVSRGLHKRASVGMVVGCLMRSIRGFVYLVNRQEIDPEDTRQCEDVLLSVSPEELAMLERCRVSQPLGCRPAAPVAVMGKRCDEYV